VTASAEHVRISRTRTLAEHLPSWFGSIRFRIAAIYSLLLFGLATLAVGGLYVFYARELNGSSVSGTYVIEHPIAPGVSEQETVRAEFTTLEHLVNERALETLRNRAFFALSLLFLASLFVGWWVSGVVLAPIQRITDVAREISATDLARRIDLGGPKDELRNLADTFDGMLARLEEAFESQRRLIQDASHELRNPLAVMRTNLDVALADPNADPAEVREAATVVRRTAERMSRLVDDLLTYARHGLPDEQWEEVELGPIVQEAVDEFARPAEARSLELVHATAAGVCVMADRTELKQALANLVANAVRLAPAGTTITVASGIDLNATGSGGSISGTGTGGTGIGGVARLSTFSGASTSKVVVNGGVTLDASGSVGFASNGKGGDGLGGAPADQTNGPFDKGAYLAATGESR